MVAREGRAYAAGVRILDRLREKDVIWTNRAGAKRLKVGGVVTHPVDGRFRITRLVESDYDPDRVVVFGVRAH